MSETVAPGWNGVCDASGAFVYGTSECDYDRACDGSFMVIGVGAGKALTLETPDNSTFVPRQDGASIVRWVGADDAATLITAARAVTDDKFTETIGDLAHTGGKLLMFDSAARGAALDMSRVASIDLPAGTYALRMCIEWRGPVMGSDGNPHDVMVQVLDLRKK